MRQNINEAISDTAINIMDKIFNSLVSRALNIFMFSDACLPENIVSGIRPTLTAIKQRISKIVNPDIMFPNVFNTALCFLPNTLYIQQGKMQ